MKKLMILIVLMVCGVGFGAKNYDTDLIANLDRNSVAFNESDFTEVIANVARTKTIAVSSRITQELDDINTRQLMAVDGDLLICNAIGGDIFTITPELFQIGIDTDTFTYTTITAPGAGSARGFIVLRPGVWLANYAEGDNVASTIYKTEDYGDNWTLSTGAMTMGYVNPWAGFDAVTDSEGVIHVVCGEYGLNKTAETNQKGRIYYSDDEGDTFTEIYDPADNFVSVTNGLLPEATELQGLHVHSVSFKGGDPTSIYVMYGDVSSDVDAPAYGDQTRLFKLVNNGSSWDYTLIQGFGHNPTSRVVDGDYIYYGPDGHFERTIFRLDTTDDTFEDVYSTRFKGGFTTAPLWEFGTTGQSFEFQKIDGIFYCPIRVTDGLGSLGKPMIAVSPDGEHWTPALREVLAPDPGEEAGTFNIKGKSGGYIWCTVYLEAGNRHLGRFLAPKVELKTAIYAEEGVTNILDTTEQSAFETAGVFWQQFDHYDPADSGRKLASAEGIPNVYGDYVFKTGGDDVDAAQVVIVESDFATYPTIRDKIKMSFWVYAKSTLNRKISLYQCKMDSSSGMLDENRNAYIIPTNQWRKVTIWTTAFATFAAEKYTCKWILSRLGGMASGTAYVLPDGDWNDIEMYYDAVSLYHNANRWTPGGFQVGGTPRLDESSAATIADVDTEFTTSFIWTPESDSIEFSEDVHIFGVKNAAQEINIYREFIGYSAGTVTVASGDCTLAGGVWPSWVTAGDTLVIGRTPYEITSRDDDTGLTVVGADVVAATIYSVVSADSGALIATDGTNTASIPNFDWSNDDWIKIAISVEPSRITLYAETSFELFVSNSAEASLLGTPTELIIGTSYDGSATGSTGTYCDVLTLDFAASQSEIEDLFDGTIPTRGTGGGASIYGPKQSIYGGN